MLKLFCETMDYLYFQSMLQRNKLLQQQKQAQQQQERNRLLQQQQQQQLLMNSNATAEQLQPGLQNLGSLLNDAVAPNVSLQVSVVGTVQTFS